MNTVDLSVLDRAEMITADADRQAACILRSAFSLEQPPVAVARARLVATAHGIYDARVNGEASSDSVLDPGWTAYEWRLQVQQHDVTALITAGGRDVQVEVELGNGWWRGDLGYGEAHANYGEDLGFLGVLEVEYDDGSLQYHPTSTSWAACTSPTILNNLYQGQRIDARIRGAEESLPVRAVDVDRSALVAQTSPPVRRHDIVSPQRIWISPSGRTLVDFGQNLVGWVRLNVSGPEGTEIVLRHAEMLDAGELATVPLRSARATDTFVLSGGPDLFEPRMTFHGFRYVEVTGWPGELTDGSIEAVVVHSALSRTGWFTSSDDRVDQLVRNSVWSQKGNFLAIPTDCPQRDERMGWTGDIAVYADTACFQFDCADFLHNWLLDLRAETLHHPHRHVPPTVPHLLMHSATARESGIFGDAGPTAVWGDAAVWVAEALWWAYGDRQRLAEHYPGMVLHLESVLRVLSPTGLWDTGFQFGDWLDPDAPPNDAARAKADPAVVATASLFRSAAFAAVAAAELGETAEARQWSALAEQTQNAFIRHYVDDGRIRSDCATVYALALHFGVVEGDHRRTAAARLAEIVTDAGYRVSTGFAGTPYVTWALSENGYVDEAYRLLLQTECPSWLYPVTSGATTIWERWDSLRPDGSINPDGMTSFNHYALGSVADWLYKVVAGIRPAEPGYRRIRIQPRPAEGLEQVHVAYDSAVGPITVAWSTDAGALTIDVSVPDGILADIVLPDGQAHTVSGGAHRYLSSLHAKEETAS